MVDVSEKKVSKRTATARSVVQLPDAVLELLANGELHTKKGAVFQTAIIAGTMAAKKTGELIPLCHPLGLENCILDIRVNERREVVIHCTASVEAKTGVEMEALVGASVAALTIYDMCKAVDKGMVIEQVRLLEKLGGKSGHYKVEA